MQNMNNMDSFSNSMQQTATPLKPSSPHQKYELVNKGLDVYLQTKKSRDALKWGTINVAILSILLFDISNKCPFTFSKWFYLEYLAAIVFGLSVCYNFTMYFYFLFSIEPVTGTEAQRRLFKFSENDTSFVTTVPTTTKQNAKNNAINLSTLSWHSSMNDSNRSVSSPGWAYTRGSPQSTPFNQSYNQNTSWSSFQNNSFMNTSNQSPNNSTSFTSPYQKYSKHEITDEKGLQQYLKEVSANENISNIADLRHNKIDRNSMNSFWNYCNNAANLLKSSLYQLSPTTVSPIKQTSNKDELGIFSGNDLDAHSDVIKKICSTGHLTQYVYNLRMWLACTILQRLEAEIGKTNHAFEARGFSDIQIGNVGLERLKKTADNHQLVTMYAPMLPRVVPFLEMSTNQEYLVQRIKDLANGCVLAEYRWNSGGSYNGLQWDEHLPTDSAIVFHVFCAYLDSQLPPLPQPGGRPFYNRYVVFGDKKSPKEILIEVKNKSKCAILCTNLMKPKFNFISDDKIHNCVYDRNNLFYVIVEFLFYMKTHNEGLLDGVNLGRSGINLLKTIGE